MNVKQLIKVLSEIEDQRLEVYCQDGMDPSDLCKVDLVSVRDDPKGAKRKIVEIESGYS
jgi:hypothetical protein